MVKTDTLAGSTGKRSRASHLLHLLSRIPEIVHCSQLISLHIKQKDCKTNKYYEFIKKEQEKISILR